MWRLPEGKPELGVPFSGTQRELVRLPLPAESNNVARHHDKCVDSKKYDAKVKQYHNGTSIYKTGFIKIGNNHGQVLVLLSVEDAIGDISGNIIIKSGAVEQCLRDGDVSLSLFPIGLDENCSCKKN